jgi:hypothetical protein
MDAIRQSFSNSGLTSISLMHNSFSGQKLTVFEPSNEEELKDILKSVNIKSCALDPIPASIK